MKRTLCIIPRLVAIFALVIPLSGCDFFRALAGRPTSADIEEMKAQIELEKIVSAQADSANMEKLRLERMDDYRDSLYGLGVTVSSSDRISNLSASQLTYCYYIMIGTFSSVENADRLVARASDAGYQAVKLAYSNGKTAVALCPSDNPEETYQSLNRVRNESFCPSDVWILVKE